VHLDLGRAPVDADQHLLGRQRGLAATGGAGHGGQG
jgi:hypothetical protein